MFTESDIQRARSAQVGFMMRAYREGFLDEDGNRGMSQEELLRHMATVEGSYAERFSHSTVSRWENGVTRPSLERMKIFGRALRLSDVEVAGLILLSGLAPDFETAGTEVGLAASGAVPDHALTSNRVFVESERDQRVERAAENSSPILRPLVQFVTLRILALGLLFAAFGYALSALGWDGDWMPVAYIGIATGLVLMQGLVWPDRRAGLRDFLWSSLFLVLTLPSLQFAPLQMDQYGFYAIGDLAGTHLPYMLVLLLSLLVAGVCALMFQLLWRWQNSSSQASASALARAVRVVLPPTLLAYVVVVVLSNYSVWIQSAVVLSVLAGVLVALLLMRDPSVNPNGGQRRFLLYASFTTAIVCSTLGMAVIVAVFMMPDVPSVFPDHNLMGSWEIDFDGMGLSKTQALELLQVGYMWHAICLFVYMVSVVGGHLLVAVYRMAGGTGTGPDAVRSDVSSPAVAGNPRGGGYLWWKPFPKPMFAMNTERQG